MNGEPLQAQIRLVDLDATGRALYGEETFREMRLRGGYSPAEIGQPDWRFEIVIPASGGTGDTEISMNAGATAADVAATLAREALRREEKR